LITYGESLALYRDHTFRKKDKERKSTDEDYILLDVRGLSKIREYHPGTVTVEGFEMEFWEYEEKFGKPQKRTIFFGTSDVPSLPAKKIRRRLDHLRRGVGKFWMESYQDEADFREFTGDMGYVKQYSVRNYLRPSLRDHRLWKEIWHGLEILHIKLQVERIRLLVGGEAVGLSEVESPGLNREEVRTVVLRLLGCIQHVVEHSEQLGERYGLRPVQTTALDVQEPPSQSQLILGPIFKRD
jgi:hypothetical protein